MSERFDLRPLLSGLAQGLRNRRNVGEESPDFDAWAILLGFPIIAGLVVLIYKIELSKADQLLAGTAIFVGALLASFAQVASWRDRIAARDRRVDGIHIRALNEVAAHILLSVLISSIATAVLAVLANMDLESESPSIIHIILARGLSAIGVSAFVYVLISVVIVVNLLWDAYEEAGD